MACFLITLESPCFSYGECQDDLGDSEYIQACPSCGWEDSYYPKRDATGEPLYDEDDKLILEESKHAGFGILEIVRYDGSLEAIRFEQPMNELDLRRYLKQLKTDKSIDPTESLLTHFNEETNKLEVLFGTIETTDLVF